MTGIGYDCTGEHGQWWTDEVAGTVPARHALLTRYADERPALWRYQRRGWQRLATGVLAGRDLCGRELTRDLMRLGAGQREIRRRVSPTELIGAPMNTRTIAILALVIAVILVIILFVV